MGIHKSLEVSVMVDIDPLIQATAFFSSGVDLSTCRRVAAKGLYLLQRNFKDFVIVDRRNKVGKKREENAISLQQTIQRTT